MRKKRVQLSHIEKDHTITHETDPQFLISLKKSLLYELKERGYLNEIQCRYALEALQKDRKK